MAALIDEVSGLPLWIDETSTNAVLAFRKVAATRALRAARTLFLATLTEKPSGISDGEYLLVHGVTRAVLGTGAAHVFGFSNLINTLSGGANFETDLFSKVRPFS